MALDIFLCDAPYNEYLRDRFALDRAELLLELPLDSITALKLREEAAKAGLQVPVWPGVGSLPPGTSAEYQEVARVISRGWGLARVHLDVYWWGGDRAAAI